MNGNDWVRFARYEALRAHGFRLGEPAVKVDRACPECGSSERWVRMEVLGETPGRTDVIDGKLVAIPARREKVTMACGYGHGPFVYGGEFFTDQEQAGRTGQLAAQAKMGRVPR